MADIYFNCACGKSLAVDERGAGHAVNCVDCGRRVTVPAFEIEFNCEQCRATLLAPASGTGNQIKCTVCGRRLTIPAADVDHEPSLTAEVWDNAAWHVPSEVQIRRRPKPEPTGIARQRPVSLLFWLALLVLALAVGMDMVLWFISARRAEMAGQKRPPSAQTAGLDVGAEPFDRPFRQAEDLEFAGKLKVPRKPVMNSIEPDEGLARADSDQPATQDVKMIEEPDVVMPEYVMKPVLVETSLGLPGVSVPAPVRNSNAVSAVAPLGFIEPKAQQSPSAPVQRARTKQNELMRKFMALDALRVKRPGPIQPGEYVKGLRQFRAVVDAYGKEHTGQELEDAAWDVIFRQTYDFIGKYGCLTYGESEQLVREGYDVLTEIDLPHWRWPHKLLIDLVAGHVGRWQDREPLLTADLLDSAASQVLVMNDRELTGYWYWRMDVPLLRFLWRSESMAPEQRKIFYNSREQVLLAGLNNDFVPLGRRSDLLSDWARYLVRNGQSDKAAQMVNEWRRKYGPAAYNADFCRIWLETALFASGDWDEADQALRAATQCAAKWTKPSDRRQYEMICRTYYDNWLWPGIELQRRRWAEAQKARGPADAPVVDRR